MGKKTCGARVRSKEGTTTNMAQHLFRVHGITSVSSKRKKVPDCFAMESKEVDFANLPFRVAWILMTAKQYLPYSMMEEKVVQDCMISFAKEHGADFRTRPKFLTRKTISADFKKLADAYVEQVFICLKLS